MNIASTMNKAREKSAWPGLVLVLSLLVLGLVLMAGTATAADSQGPPPQLNPAQRGQPAAPQGDGVWTPLGGPIAEGGQVNALAVHPTLSGTVYAAVAPPGAYDSGPSVIYKTTDGAATWTPVYTAEHEVYSLAVTGTVVYAGAFNPGGEGASIYASQDSGATWTPVFSATDRGVWLDISVHPTDTDVAIIGGWFYHQVGPDHPQSGLVYRTDDAGLTWTPILTLTYPGAEASLNAVMIHPVTPTLLLASSHTWGGPNDQDSYVLRSEDGGATWPISVTMPNAHVISFAANTSPPSMLYAGAGFGTFSDGRAVVFRSTDAGLTWDEVHDSGTHLAYDPIHDRIYTIMDTGQAYVSSSDGDPGSWIDIGGIWDNALAFDLDLGPAPVHLYAGGSQQGVFKGVLDGDWTWDQYNTNIENPLPPRDIDIDPANPDKMFAATDCTGGWLSTDGGWNWTQLEEACMGAYAINPDDPNIVYGGEYNCGRGPVRRSEDGGLNFKSVFTPTFIISDCSGGDETIFDIAIAPSMTSTVYAVGADHPAWTGDSAVAVRSLDDGVSWTVVFTLPEWSQIGVVTIDPTDDDIVYLGGEACDQFGCEGFIYRSTDAGVNWTLVLTDPHQIASIVVDYQKPNVLYAAATGPYNVYKSTDGGDSWEVIRSNEPPFEEPSGYLLAIDPNAPSHVYLGGWGYIAETPDGGQTWSEWGDPINNGTPGMEPQALVVDTGTPTQTLYAGFSGAWAYSRPAPQPGEAMTITMTTEPISGVVYANGLNNGLFHGLVVDGDENWVANGTPVTVTYEWSFGSDTGEVDIVKSTEDGGIMGGFLRSASTGVTSFTARANVTATAFVSIAWIYNPPAGIDVGAVLTEAATALVTATVPGVHDGVASDGTIVNFESSLGTIDAAVPTFRGVATATLTADGSGGVATITATVDEFSDSTTVDFGPYRIYLPMVVKND